MNGPPYPSNLVPPEDLPSNPFRFPLIFMFVRIQFHLSGFISVFYRLANLFRIIKRILVIWEPVVFFYPRHAPLSFPLSDTSPQELPTG